VTTAKQADIGGARWALLAMAVLAAAMMIGTTLAQDKSPAGAPQATASTAASTPAPRWGARTRRAIPADQEAEMMAFTKQYMPELHKQFQQLEKDDPPRAARVHQQMYWLWRRVQRYPAGPVRDAAVARQRINVDVYKAARAYRQTADDGEKAKLRKELTELLGRRFDHDQVVKEYDITLLEKQLAELKADIERRRKNRTEVIADSVTRLLASLPTSHPGGPPAP
jgi:hypothetical protein